MRLAINLDCQSCRGAIEIENIIVDGVLFAEAQPGFVPAQRESEPDLGRRHFLAQALRIAFAAWRSFEPHRVLPLRRLRRHLPLAGEDLA